MRQLVVISIAIFGVSVARADPNLIGRWVSDRESSASFNEHKAVLLPKTASFLRQSMGRLAVVFSHDSVTWRMPDFDTKIEGKRHSLKGFSEQHAYQVLGTTDESVAIKTTEPVTGRQVIYVYIFDGPDKMWVYVDTNGSHLREYFVRAANEG
jgi:hypothetical protein